jgi:hypothetical protein
LVDVLSAALDVDGPEQLMDTPSRMYSPRVGEVLETIGPHHPVKPAAKAAREALVKPSR